MHAACAAAANCGRVMNVPVRKDHRKSFVFATSLLIIAALTGAYAYVWLAEYNDVIMKHFMSKGNWLIVFLYVVLQLLLARIYGGYRVGHLRMGNVIYSSLLCTLFVNVLTYFQVSLIGRMLMPVLPMVWLTLAQAAVIALWAWLANWGYTHLYPPRRLLMVYGSQQVQALSHKMGARREKYVIADTVNVHVGVDAICRRLQDFDGVILCDVKSEQRNQLLKYCYGHSVRAYITPKISDVILRGSQNVDLFDTPLFLCPNTGLTPEQAVVKRAFDLVVAGLMALLTSPLMLLTALAVKLQDGGPVLYRQARCTLNGKVFNVLKFRSMIVNAEKDGKSHPAVDGDPRITPVGRIIRKTRIDELPQLFNVLKGDMSVVGPRPERVEHVRDYSADIPEFTFRLKVKAGLTGYAQIYGKYNTSAYDKLKLDLMYMERYSLLLDMKLLLMTVKILFMGESTQGFAKQPTLQDEEGDTP